MGSGPGGECKLCCSCFAFFCDYYGCVLRRVLKRNVNGLPQPRRGIVLRERRLQTHRRLLDHLRHTQGTRSPCPR